MNSKDISNKTPRRLLLIFEILSLLLLLLYQKENTNKDTIMVVIGFILVVYFSNLILNKISSGDYYIFLIATMLMSIGIIMIYRLDPSYGGKQLVWVIIGIICFFITYFILKYIKIWDRLMYLYVIIAYILFALTLGIGEENFGATNWIELFGIGFQPAELTKLIIIFFLASYYGYYMQYRELRTGRYASYIVMAIIYSFIGLLFLQRDLGMALIFYGIFIVIQFIYEEDRKIILINLALFTISGILGIILFNHVQIRFKIWIDPWKYIDGSGYQITQSLFAIAEGGFFGKGLGLGHPQLIPLAYNDFIYPAIIEEMGIFTGIGIIMLYMILVYRGFKIALNQSNKFLRILAIGVSALFGVQSFVILGGVMKLIPLTGITLPFMAYGGTSILSSFIALAILQLASEDIEWEDDPYGEGE